MFFLLFGLLMWYSPGLCRDTKSATEAELLALDLSMKIHQTEDV